MHFFKQLYTACFFVLCCILYSTSIYGQKNIADSLIQSLKNTQPDTKAFVDINNRLSGFYKQRSISRSYEYTQTALEVSRKISYFEGEADALANMGMLSALQFKFEDAVTFLRESLKTAEKVKYGRGYSNVFLTFGMVYEMFDRNAKAIDFYKKAADSLRTQSPSDACFALLRIGVVYTKASKAQSALDFLFNAQYIAQEQNLSDQYATILAALAQAYVQLEMFDNATDFAQRALTQAIKNNLPDQRADAFKALAQISLQKKKYPEASQWLDSAIFYSLQTGNAREQQRLYAQKAIAAEMQGNYKLAYTYITRSREFNDSIFADRNSFYLAELNVMTDIAQRSIENARLKNEQSELDDQIRKGRIYIGIMVALVVIMALVVWWSFRLNQRNRVQNKQLIEQKAQIEAQSLQQRDEYKTLELLSKLGRDVQANLSVETITETLYQNMNSLIDVSMLGIGIYVEHTNKLEFVGVRSNGKTLPPFYLDVSDDHLAVWCFREQKDVVVGDLVAELPQYANSVAQQYVQLPPRSIIYCPISLRGNIIGVVLVQSQRPNVYNNYHLHIIKNLATNIGIAIDNAGMYQRLEIQEQELRRANATKDKMFSIIGHDLRSPIGNFNTILDFMIDESQYQEKDRLVQMLYELRQSASSTFNLLDNLLSWAKSQQGEIVYRPEKIDINVIVRENIELLRGVSDFKGINLSSVIDKRMVVYADDNMITTVIRNLISNAIKFTPNEGSIIVSGRYITQLGKNLVEISVTDTGVGIKSENIEKIFNKTYHYTTYGTNNEKGSGLGLILCQDFVERNNGSIWVESKLGEGSSFKFTLPAVVD